MNLILASELTACLPKIEKLLGGVPKGKMLIIPTAARGEGWEPPYESHYQPFEAMGFEPVEFDLNGKSEAEVEIELTKSAAVYVCGGNTFVLLEHMRKSGFTKLVRRFLEKGLVYIGSSAGAVVATPDIGYAASMDDPSRAVLSDYQGLHLIDFALMPHMDHETYGPIAQHEFDRFKSQKFGDFCIPLNDDQLIYVEGRTVRIF